MIDLNAKYGSLIKYMQKEAPFIPDISLILGSGLGGFATSLDVIKEIPTGTIPGYPPSTIIGHEGKILFAVYEGKKVLLFQGRIHFYEGYSISECILPVFITHKLQCKKIFITNAAGGINSSFKPGDLMLALSFNGISIKKELASLVGIPSVEGKTNLVNFPSEDFNKAIRAAAYEERIDLKEGVYWYSKGPSYETPAEINMMGTFGADAVGMSTVHEAFLSAYLGVETASVSCITNYAAGISTEKLSHAEVTETANLVKDKFERLVKAIIRGSSL